MFKSLARQEVMQFRPDRRTLYRVHAVGIDRGRLAGKGGQDRGTGQESLVGHGDYSISMDQQEMVQTRIGHE